MKIKRLPYHAYVNPCSVQTSLADTVKPRHSMFQGTGQNYALSLN